MAHPIMAMADKHRLTVATYNLHGLNQGKPYLVSLCNEHDFIFVQEHWLAPSDLNCLEKISNNVVCYASSALDDAISRSCLKGRPFGGLAIFVNNRFATGCRLVSAANRYIILQYEDMLFINVYLPCRASAHCEEEFVDCLASIMHVISELQYSSIIFGGDMNIDITETNVLSNVLANFVHDLGLKFVDDKLPIDERDTFRVISTGATSTIDHFAVSESMYDAINMVKVIDSGINLSDHCPLIVDVNVTVYKKPVHKKPVHKRPSKANNEQMKFRWDKGDIFLYYTVSHDLLSAVKVPTYLLSDSSYHCPRADILECVNRYYNEIVHALYIASCVTIPQKSITSLNIGGTRNSVN